MKLPIIKIQKTDKDIIFSINYDDINVKAGYKSDGTIFVLSDKPIADIANEFTKISCKMWNAVCSKFNLNPGYALEIGLIDLKYCKQMQFAGVIGYDLRNMASNKQKSNRDIEELFNEI